MYFDVECAVCELSAEYDDVDAVLDLQERHQETYGDHHVLEFERILDGEERNDGS